MSSNQFQQNNQRANVALPIQQQQAPYSQQQQQQHDADAARFDNLCKSLSLVNIIKDSITIILDNVAKSNQHIKDPSSNSIIDQLSDNPNGNSERSHFLHETDLKYLQDKAIDLNSKISELDHLINAIQPIQINSNEFFTSLLDHFDEKSTLNASKVMFNYRWLKNAFDEKSSVAVNSSLQYKRYQVPYMERKSPKYRIYKPLNKPDQFEKSLNQYMNVPQSANTVIKVTVIEEIDEKEITIDIQMPQYFKFVLHMFDYIIEAVHVKCTDPRTMSSSEGFEDIDRKIRLPLFERLEENAVFASIFYKNTVENSFQAFKHLLNWLKHYANLFTAKCVRCEKHLMNGYPPLWRDLKTYDIYHDECKI